MKLEKGKSYNINGVDVYINNKGNKCIQYSKLEQSKNGREIAEKLFLSHKYKSTDVIGNIHYNKSSDDYFTRWYIDENYDGLSVLKYENEASKRISVTLICATKNSDILNVYVNIEQINNLQELKIFGTRFEIVKQKNIKYTDKKLFEEVKKELDTHKNTITFI